MRSRPLLTLFGVLIAALVLVSCGGSMRSPLMDEGRGIYTGRGCSSCHGGRGQGGAGPALTGAITTFPSCDDQLQWVSLGSDGWKADVGDTYGASAKPVKGGMPTWGSLLTDHEVRAVVAYERVDFGGGDEDAVRADCGL